MGLGFERGLGWSEVGHTQRVNKPRAPGRGAGAEQSRRCGRDVVVVGKERAERTCLAGRDDRRPGGARPGQ